MSGKSKKPIKMPDAIIYKWNWIGLVLGTIGAIWHTFLWVSIFDVLFPLVLVITNGWVLLRVVFTKPQVEEHNRNE